MLPPYGILGGFKKRSGMRVDKIVVRSETDAFKLIERALKNELDDAFELKFENWPEVSVVLNGKGYEGTITPSLMQGLVELQHGLNRTYAQLARGYASAKNLKDVDREELEFKARVSEGSSIVNIDLADFATKLASEMVGKMDGSQLVLAALGAAALWASQAAYKHYVNAEVKKKELAADADKMVKLSEQETRRMELMAQALSKEPRLAVIEKDASLTSLNLLRGVSDAESINLNGVKLTNDQAWSVVSAKRSASSEIQINGNYRILAVDASRDDEFRIKVKYLPDGREFFAKFRDDSLDQEHLKALQEAEWGKTNVYLSVNATELRGQITTATIISATQQPIP